jgi:cytochrome c553
MEPISAGLSEEALREVARYYAAAVAADPVPPGVTDEAAIERGRLIAQHGIPAQRVPSCIDCHAPEGERYNANYPALEAQHADYLSNSSTRATAADQPTLILWNRSPSASSRSKCATWRSTSSHFDRVTQSKLMDVKIDAGQLCADANRTARLVVTRNYTRKTGLRRSLRL